MLPVFLLSWGTNIKKGSGTCRKSGMEIEQKTGPDPMGPNLDLLNGYMERG